MPAPEIVTPDLLRNWPLPDPAGSKTSRGEVLVIGGAASTPGAVALAGLAALRVGAGKVQLAVAASAAPSLAATFPEAKVVPLPEAAGGAIQGSTAAERVLETLDGADAVLVGPGLDDAPEATTLLASMLPELSDQVDLVLDAFALGALAHGDELTARLARRPVPALLTPNSTELGLLAGGEADPGEEHVLDVAQRYRCCVSSLSTVATPDRRAWRIPLGDPGLATAGSGDVLAGLVAGVLARGAEVEQAACWGTFLHATAGERLSSSVGGVGFLARELVDEVPRALAEIT